MINEIVRITNSPKHHLFGFHDLIASNKSGDKILSLETDVCNRPPLAGEEFGVGYSLWKEQRFVKLGTTVAMNYPQGARQQWLNDSQFTVNNMVVDHWGTDIYDVTNGTKISSIDSPTHCLSKDKKWSFGINYSRLHRLGGYGYIGLQDKSESDAIPGFDGIFKTEIASNTTKLLVSIADVAKTDAITSANNGFHHYVTHLVLSPDGKRLAFLHRFFLADGGIRTRLMTVGVNGEGLRCIACGFLSHFDWKDEKSIYIWGRAGSSMDAVRSNPLFSNPIVKPVLGVAKGVARKLLKRSKGMAMSFLMCKDQEEKAITHIAEGIITCDGHPMTCPTDRNICICDTYPLKDKHRDLFFYDFERNERINIGHFFMGDQKVDTVLFNEYTRGVDKKILSLMSPELFSFTRSGLHCDLHPRWDANGKMAIFDSIHEGSRQIYAVKL